MPRGKALDEQKVLDDPLGQAEDGERSFCADCGTSLTFLDPTEPEIVDVTLASLDDPEAFPPEHHIWTSSRVTWLDLADGLPRHSEARQA